MTTNEPSPPIKCALFVTHIREDDGTTDSSYLLARVEHVTDAILNQLSSNVPHIEDIADWTPEDFFTAGLLFNFHKSEFWPNRWEEVSVGRYSARIFFSATKEFPSELVNAGTHVIVRGYSTRYNLPLADDDSDE